MRILESKNIQFELIDISVGGDIRNEMRTKSGNPNAAPPQIFNEDQYCGVSIKSFSLENICKYSIYACTFYQFYLPGQFSVNGCYIHEKILIQTSLCTTI